MVTFMPLVPMASLATWIMMFCPFLSVASMAAPFSPRTSEM